jgi:phosphate/sulfate permease
MIVAIIILSWLLINSWIVIAVLGFEDKWRLNEWGGILISVLFSPLVTLGIAQPIFTAIENKRKKKKRG